MKSLKFYSIKFCSNTKSAACRYHSVGCDGDGESQQQMWCKTCFILFILLDIT